MKDDPIDTGWIHKPTHRPPVTDEQWEQRMWDESKPLPSGWWVRPVLVIAGVIWLTGIAAVLAAYL